MWNFFLFLGVIHLGLGAPVRWELKAVSWNINGAPKFRSLAPERAYLAQFDVVFLQETCSVTEGVALELDGYIPFHGLARYTGGKPQWGMTSLFRILSFVGDTLRPVPTGADWIQVEKLFLVIDIGW